VRFKTERFGKGTKEKETLSRKFTFLCCVNKGAAGFALVLAVAKTAIPQKRLKFLKSSFQLGEGEMTKTKSL
jgi:hypothetical protein